MSLVEFDSQQSSPAGAQRPAVNPRPWPSAIERPRRASIGSPTPAKRFCSQPEKATLTNATRKRSRLTPVLQDGLVLFRTHLVDDVLLGLRARPR